ncbi:hypothetical protein [Pseudomonas cremoricolorata]|nr:hypothetical protein [Pseudomonas cremoricolorata]
MSLFDRLFGGRVRQSPPDEAPISDAEALCGLAAAAQTGLSLKPS